MLKNILFTLIFFVSINCSAKTFDFIIKDENQHAIQGAAVEVNGEKKLTDKSGKIVFDIDSDYLEVEVTKKDYSTSKFSLNEKSRKQNEVEVVLKKLPLSLVAFNFNVEKGWLKYKNLRDQIPHKIPFNKNFLKLSLTEGRHEFTFSSENHIEIKKILNINRNFSTFNINFEKKSEQFFITTNNSKASKLLFLDQFPRGHSPVDQCKIILSRAGLPIQEIELKKDFEIINLDYGVYDIKVEAPGYETFNADGTIINENLGNFILLNLKPIKTFVSGYTRLKESLIGGVDIYFKNENGKLYSSRSTLSGKFSAELPPGKYTVKTQKPGYEFNLGNDNVFEFSEPDKIYNLDITLKEVPSIIRGLVVDRRGFPIQDAEVLVRIEDSEKTFQTDSKGNFSGEVGYGVAFIKIEKNGFRPYGTIKKVERFSTMNNLRFSLNPYLSSVSGFLTDGVKPLKNIKLSLYDGEDRFTASSLSGENGYYEFPDLNISKEYYIKVSDSDYFEYSSKKFILGKNDFENFNLIISSSSLKFILELSKPDGEIVNNELVLINGQEFITDINGIIIDELKNFLQDENIRVEIPKYSSKKIFKFNPNDSKPFKINMVLD